MTTKNVVVFRGELTLTASIIDIDHFNTDKFCHDNGRHSTQSMETHDRGTGHEQKGTGSLL